MIIGRDFLDLARRLAAGGAEADWRTAISRAYYSTFHAARQLMQDLGFTVPRGDQAHRHVWLRLSNCGDAAVRSAGAGLNALRQERNRADYDLALSVRQPEALKLIRLAEQIIQTLDAARQEPTRTQITDAMKVYERDVLGDVTWHP
jgi:uncharacterized protein (UPF0332 family)